jgi:hypothetical protein
LGVGGKTFSNKGNYANYRIDARTGISDSPLPVYRPELRCIFGKSNSSDASILFQIAKTSCNPPTPPLPNKQAPLLEFHVGAALQQGKF